MTPKTERFELRLPPEILQSMDEWRSKQFDLPSRSEAVRRLIERALSSSDKQTYTIMRFQILNESLSYFLDKNKSDSVLRYFLPGDIYCWKRDIFPLHDAELANAFANQFDVTKTMFEYLWNFLWELFEDKKTITFYELAAALEVDKPNNPWTRKRLILSCRYLADHSDFDEDFWKSMLRNSPIEAEIIIKPISDEEALKGNKLTYKFP